MHVYKVVAIFGRFREKESPFIMGNDARHSYYSAASARRVYL